jgi:2'-5' RNA ligase
MRAFIAIDVPEEVKRRIAAIQERLSEIDLACKWVHPENIHLTLKFLGEINPDQLEKIKTAVCECAAGFKAFEADLERFGFFPNEKRPRVFFISTSGAETLKAMADNLEDKLKVLGFQKEGRFKSHITLARIKHPKNIDRLLRELNKISLRETFAVKEITLYKSTLTPKGAVYEKLASSILAA